MNPTEKLSAFGPRLRYQIEEWRALTLEASDHPDSGTLKGGHRTFDELALELFQLQFELNEPYRKLCEARQRTPERVEHWSAIPAIPAAGFKEWELSCLPEAKRTTVFYSSGTTG